MATTQQGAMVPAGNRQLTTIFQFLNQAKGQITDALPKHMTPERMIRVARTAISKTPKLQECSPLSIVGAVIEASQLGLEPDGVLGMGYLIPRYNKKTQQVECSFQPGYRGLIALALRSGQVSWVAAELVFDCDKFQVKYGTQRDLIHEPDLDNADRGAKDENGHLVGLRGAYAVIRFKDGTTDFEYMNKAQLDQIRARSEAEQKGWFSPWKTDEDEMYRKAPIRRGAKRWPLSPEFQKAAIMDEYRDAGVSVEQPDFEVPELVAAATEARTKQLEEKYAPKEEAQPEPEKQPEPEPQPAPKRGTPKVQAAEPQGVPLKFRSSTTHFGGGWKV